MSEVVGKRAAVVTGGSRGIGRAICVALAKQGCNVVVNYCHGVDAARTVCASRFGQDPQPGAPRRAFCRAAAR